MSEVFIVGAKRTAIGSFLGTLKDVKASDLASSVMKQIIDDTKIDTKDLDEVILGQVLPAGQGQGPARQASINAGIEDIIPAYSLNMVCGSGMKSVMNGYVGIKAGLNHLVMAGGMESMSQSPFLLPYTLRLGKKMGGFETEDHMLKDALMDAFDDVHMGITAENIVEKYEISRERQDKFAMLSQTKAVKAVDEGKFKDEIVPVTIKTRKGDVVFDLDEYPNRTTDFEKLSGLRPAFKRDGSVSAGNSSGLNDGASVVLLADQTMLDKYDLKPLVRIVGVGQGGVNPKVMRLGPSVAIKNALDSVEMDLKEMDLLELNEAFSAQGLGVYHELAELYDVNEDWFTERTNLNGGAIALGHPLGASGNRILVTLIHELIKQNKRYGLASLCIGGGMGTAIIVENLEGAK
ncbi:MAG: acetyl-CoA C-acetyltransferase [Erysipelothrix sp.]|nr:acetyl-CoA C-acetyltransferase [Erysipelothrix sp.]